jgi:nucleoside-diphosphate-sugar epimerase
MKIFLTGASGFIGTNAVKRYLAAGDEVLNVDIEPPLNPAQRPYWKQVDILDAAPIRQVMADFAPEAVIHLAARSDCVEDTTVEEGYRVNTDGTRHVLAAIQATPSVRRLVVSSSQFVCGAGYAPEHDEDFHPVTVYGQSKVITEQLTRAAGLSCTWTIVRPTNIWGPWHLRYQREFWRVLARGWYVHPAGAPVIRCYGYVGNLVQQMRQLLDQPEECVNGQVFYLGDRPGDITGWVNAFSIALRGRKTHLVPRPVLAAASLVGDAIGALTGRPFYINTSRFQSMTTDYLVNIDRTFRLLGEPPISLEEGVAETVAWLLQSR